MGGSPKVFGEGTRSWLVDPIEEEEIEVERMLRKVLRDPCLGNRLLVSLARFLLWARRWLLSEAVLEGVKGEGEIFAFVKEVSSRDPMLGGLVEVFRILELMERRSAS